MKTAPTKLLFSLFDGHNLDMKTIIYPL